MREWRRPYVQTATIEASATIAASSVPPRRDTSPGTILGQIACMHASQQRRVDGEAKVMEEML